jgi:hypothetical protein
LIISFVVPGVTINTSFTTLLLLRPPAFIHKKGKSEATGNGESWDDGEHDDYEGYNYDSENYLLYEVSVHASIYNYS